MEAIGRWCAGALAMLAAAALVVSTPGRAQAGKPSGGGGGTTGPAGQIVFAQDSTTGRGNDLWISNTSGVGAEVPAAGLDYMAGVTQSRHGGGQLWFFQWRDVAEPVLIGDRRRDLFAVREDGLRVLRLTNNPYFVGAARPEVLPGDSGLSLSACRWAYDSSNAPQVLESGLWTAPLTWVNDEPVLGTPTLRIPWAYTVDGRTGNLGVSAWYAQYTGDGRTAIFHAAAPHPDPGVIWRADFGSSGPVLTQIAPGWGPRLAPDATRVAYMTYTATGTPAGISVCNLDGTAVVSVTQSADHAHPVWSPDSQNIAFANRKDSKGGAVYTLCWAPATTGARQTTVGSFKLVSVVLRWVP